MATFDKHRKTWTADVTAGGKRYRRRGFIERSHAEIWEGQIKWKHECQLINIPTSDTVELEKIFSDYLAHVREYRAHNTYLAEKRATEKWRAFFLHAHLHYASEINPGTWQQFKEWRGQVKPRTLNLDLLTARQAFRLAYKKKLVTVNPFSEIEPYPKKPAYLPRYLSIDEIQLIENTAQSISPQFAVAFSVLVRTGLRVSEMCSLTSRNIDLPRSQIILHPEQTKARTMRTIPMSSQVQNIITELLHQAKESSRVYLFATANGTQQTRKNIYARFRTVLRRLADSIPDHNTIHVHTLRRTYVSHAIMAGADPVKVMAIVGHRDWATMRCYLALSPAYLTQEIILPY